MSFRHMHRNIFVAVATSVRFASARYSKQCQMESAAPPAVCGLQMTAVLTVRVSTHVGHAAIVELDLSLKSHKDISANCLCHCNDTANQSSGLHLKELRHAGLHVSWHTHVACLMLNCWGKLASANIDSSHCTDSCINCCLTHCLPCCVIFCSDLNQRCTDLLKLDLTNSLLPPAASILTS